LGGNAVKAFISTVTLAFVVAFITACEPPAPEQPLTRADCEKAGKKWDEKANVCVGG
jgi:hypothetical protein